MTTNSTGTGGARAGLVAKPITDINGNVKTVWVRPEGSTDTNDALGDLKPLLKNAVNEGVTHLRKGERQGSLRHTHKEKQKASERGYGSDKLREAAASKFERDFDVPIDKAPPVVLNDEQLYDYVARGLTVEHAHEFARYGIEPHLTHPKLDAEYAFVSGPKVAKSDLRTQEKADSEMRREELVEIRKIARILQNRDVSPHVAARCIENGLRAHHLKSSNKDVNSVIEQSFKNNVESQKFKSFMEQGVTTGRAKAGMRRFGRKMAHRAGRKLRFWFKRLGRRIFNRIRRRTRRILRKTFLPWEYR